MAICYINSKQIHTHCFRVGIEVMFNLNTDISILWFSNMIFVRLCPKTETDILFLFQKFSFLGRVLGDKKKKKAPHV